MYTKKMAPANRDHEHIQAAEIVAEPIAIDKELATLQAHAARAGWRLDRWGRHYVLHRWGRCIDCFDLDAVRGALLRVGVPL